MNESINNTKISTLQGIKSKIIHAMHAWFINIKTTINEVQFCQTL